MYNEDFKYYDNYSPVFWTEVNTWNFEELSCASKEYISEYFNQPRFFEKIEFMDCYTKKVIDALLEHYEIIFISLGDFGNLRIKKEWLRIHFPYADFIGIDIKKYTDKSHINMMSGIFIDDSSHNLRTSSANIQICFGDIYPWNKDWCSLRAYNCREIGEYFRVINREEIN